MMGQVDGKALTAARKKNGWTQLELSEKTKINVSTLSRIERNKGERIRQETINRLCNALGVQPSDLCPEREPERDFMKVRVGSAARNALTLVARRYGVPRERIVEIAPLLFFVAAEQCLNDRRQQLRNLRAAADAVEAAAISHLPLSAAIDETALGLEEQSINDRDLFGVKVEEYPFGYRDPDRDEATDNPFALFLSRALEGVTDRDSGIDATVRWGAGLWPSYQICSDEAASIVGGDAEAAKAILSGVAALHEMPRPATASERADWAKDELKREFDELLALVGLAQDETPSEGATK